MDKLDSQAFYELMQAYRYANNVIGQGHPRDTLNAFEAVKEWIRENYQEKDAAQQK